MQVICKCSLIRKDRRPVRGGGGQPKRQLTPLPCLCNGYEDARTAVPQRATSTAESSGRKVGEPVPNSSELTGDNQRAALESLNELALQLPGQCALVPGTILNV